MLSKRLLSERDVEKRACVRSQGVGESSYSLAIGKTSAAISSIEGKLAALSGSLEEVQSVLNKVRGEHVGEQRSAAGETLEEIKVEGQLAGAAVQQYKQFVKLREHALGLPLDLEMPDTVDVGSLEDVKVRSQPAGHIATAMKTGSCLNTNRTDRRQILFDWMKRYDKRVFASAVLC